MDLCLPARVSSYIHLHLFLLTNPHFWFQCFQPLGPPGCFPEQHVQRFQQEQRWNYDYDHEHQEWRVCCLSEANHANSQIHGSVSIRICCTYSPVSIRKSFSHGRPRTTVGVLPRRRNVNGLLRNHRCPALYLDSKSTSQEQRRHQTPLDFGVWD